MEQHQILIVDQDADLSGEMEQLFANEAVNLLRVEKSTDALRMIQDRNIELVLLDVGSCTMPVQEIVPIIQGMEKDLPVIVICDRNTPDLEKQIRSQKIFYYHIKSFGISDLELAVKNALGKTRNRRSALKEGQS